MKGILYRRILNSIKFYESMKENQFFKSEKDFLKIDETVNKLNKIKIAVKNGTLEV